MRRNSVHRPSLVQAGKPIRRVAAELGISEGGLHNRVRQDRIDRGERPGVTTPESTGLAEARKRIRQRERKWRASSARFRSASQDGEDPALSLGAASWTLPLARGHRTSAIFSRMNPGGAHDWPEAAQAGDYRGGHRVPTDDSYCASIDRLTCVFPADVHEHPSTSGPAKSMRRRWRSS